jgi:hypothetical protein
MEEKVNEFLFYICISIAVYLSFLLYLLNTYRPNLAMPDRAEYPEIQQPPNIPPDYDFGFINTLIYVFFIILLGIIIYFVINLLMRTTILEKLASKKPQTTTEKIQKVKDARAEAYRLINEGLMLSEYKKYYILAYLALDASLESFREISRPKHWTLKEYSYNVKEPIFKPSVYKIVSRYYDYRYGNYDSSKESLELFKQELDYLFTNDVPLNVRKEMEEFYGSQIQKVKEYKIISREDLLKPIKGGPD